MEHGTGLGGFGGGLEDPSLYDPAFVTEMNKALTAGSSVNNPGAAAGEGFPLRVEDLEATLYSVTFEQKHIRFWNTLYKDRVGNTIVEFNRLLERGSGNAIFMGEGDLPAEDDSTYERAYTKIKFMGSVRRVSHVMNLMNAAHGDAIAREAKNGTLFLLREIERNLFHGDEDLLGLQFNGLEKLLVNAWGSTLEEDDQWSGWGSSNAVDMRSSMSEDIITDMADVLVNGPNYGEPNVFWSGTSPIKDLSKTMYPKERTTMGEKGVAGNFVEKVRTPFGDIRLEPDIFIDSSPKADPNGVGPAGTRPAAPGVAGIASPVYGGSYKAFWTLADQGSYYYRVVAVNRYGKSAPVNSAQIAVSAGDVVTFTVTSGTDTSYFEVYRTTKDETDITKARLISRHPRRTATQVITDKNRFLPGTSKGYMLTQTTEVLKWRQLSPYVKMPLAQIDTSIRFMLLLYGGLQVMAPGKCGIMFNIKPLATGAFA